MEPANSPEALVELCQHHRERGAKGILLSGGCDEKGGLLHLREYLPAIQQIHEMGLIIKLHTGFVDRELAAAIVDAGVDIASQEMVGDASTIKKIFSIDATPEDYLETFRILQDAGVPHICPHVCVGLDEGRLNGEFRALDLLRPFNISTLAMIVLRPTRGTDLASIPPPSGDDVERVIAHARQLFPDTKIILGALDPGARRRAEEGQNAWTLRWGPSEVVSMVPRSRPGKCWMRRSQLAITLKKSRHSECYPWNMRTGCEPVEIAIFIPSNEGSPTLNTDEYQIHLNVNHIVFHNTKELSSFCL